MCQPARPFVCLPVDFSSSEFAKIKEKLTDRGGSRVARCTRQRAPHVTSRCGPLVIAITSVLARISGDAATADLLAMGYLGALTATLTRDSAFRAVTTVAGSCVRLQPDRACTIRH